MDDSTIPAPGACPHEAAVVGGKKSLCTLHGREVWTNCRERGECTLHGDSDIPGACDGEEGDGDGLPAS